MEDGRWFPVLFKHQNQSHIFNQVEALTVKRSENQVETMIVKPSKN